MQPDERPAPVKASSGPRAPVVALAMSLLWSSSPGLVVAAFALRAVGAVFGGVVVVAASGAVRQLDRDASSTSALVDAVAVTLVVLFAAAVAANVGNRCQVLLGAIVERKTRLRMLEACANVDVAQFEDAAFHDLMERVDANALDKPAAVTFALADLASGALGVLAVVGALVVVQPLLVPVLLLGMLPMVVLAVMGGRNEVGFAHERAATDRRRDYLRRVLVDRTAAKELRLFNASHALLEMLRSEYDVHLQLSDVIRSSGSSMRWRFNSLWAEWSSHFCTSPSSSTAPVV